MSYNEIKQHGTSDFPFELYRLDVSHPKYEMAFHYHREVELIRVESGSLKVSIDHRSYLLHAGDAAWVNSESVHGASPDNCVYQCIVFSPLLLASEGETGKFFAEGIPDQTLLFPERPEGLFKQRIHELFCAAEEYDGKNRLGVLSALYALFYSASQEKYYTQKLPLDDSKSPKKLIKLKKALSFMRQHFDRSIGLEEIARAADTSPKRLCAFFKELTGETPIRYLMTYRIERAARKLLSTDLSITRIALECGFNDLSYFIKTFKAFKGIPPAAFREASHQNREEK